MTSGEDKQGSFCYTNRSFEGNTKRSASPDQTEAFEIPNHRRDLNSGVESKMALASSLHLKRKFDTRRRYPSAEKYQIHTFSDSNIGRHSPIPTKSPWS